MSLNWKEIELILSELRLEGSLVQKVVQNSFHALTWVLYAKGEGSYALYTEVGTPQSRICLTDLQTAKQKTQKLQRFIQFCRANVEGSRISEVRQTPGDREVRLTLTRHDKKLYVYIRLFSGPGANVIVTDENNIIIDLLFRRPNRNEISGSKLPNSEFSVPRPSAKEYFVRDRIEGMSFNQQVDKQALEASLETSLESCRQKVQDQRDKAVSRILGTIGSLKTTIRENEAWEDTKHIADLLASNIQLIKPKQRSVEVDDYLTGQRRFIALDPSLKPSEHAQSFYEKAKRQKGSLTNAQGELKSALERLRQTQAFYQAALIPTGDVKADLKKLKAALPKTRPAPDKNGPHEGIQCQSGQFQIVIGRTAKENDSLLRRGFKGNDYWFHTRDCPGAYVFVRCPKNKSLPLEVMLDAANLAALYSKQKNDSTVNLYYTRVKYLRRAKNGPLGKVLPTQEKNLTITPDKKRAQALLEDKEEL